LVLEKILVRKKDCAAMTSNNPLAVEPKTENDPGRYNLSFISLLDSPSIAAAAQATTTRII
jgi:hypothetical protein